jgi:hypothetical protein
VASTYSSNLAIELIGTGDQAGSWGNTTNTNLGTLIEQAISGYVTQAVATGTDTTITIPNGATGVARNMYIELTGTGGTNTNLIVPSNKKLYIIFNNTASGQVTVKVSGQTGVSVPNGKKMILVSNGTDIVNGLNYIADFGTNSFTVTNLTATSATITTLTGTSAGITTISSGSANITQLNSTSATITTLSGTTATYTSATVTNLALTSLTLSNLNIASANITTLTGSTQTLSGNLTLSGGTANGVLYLNGSKVATSGSALTFNGTTVVSPQGKFGSGVASNSQSLMVNNPSGTATQIQLFQDGVESWTMGMPASSAGLAWAASGSEQMRLTSTGLGIGTSSPSGFLANKLVIATGGTANEGMTIYSSSNNGSIWFADSTTGTGLYAGGIDYQHSTNELIFYTNSLGNMRLNASGNLGIGTTSPGARLHVVGSQFRQNDATNSYGYVINTASGTTLLETLFGGSSFGIRTGGGSTDYINIDSSGNTTAGAGTLATNATNGFLYVPTCAGTPTGTPTAKSGYAPIVVNTTNNKLYFYSGGAWRDAGP